MHPWLNWFAWRKPKNAKLTDPDFAENILGRTKTGAGVYVDEGAALSISAVYGCVRILAESIGSLPISIVERQGRSRVEATSHPLYELLRHRPNADQTPMEVIEFATSALNLRGTQYHQVLRSRRGRIGELLPLNSAHVKPRRDEDGRLRFTYEEPGAARRELESDDLWRTAGLSFNGVTGLSPVALARESLGSAIAANTAAAKLWANGMLPGGYYKNPGHLKDEAFDRLKKDLQESYAGIHNTGRPLLLEDGLEWHPLQMNAKDSQFLESRKFNIAEIARWFRVPLHMLAELDKATFSNIEHQSIEFVMHTLRPWIKRLEQSMERDLLRPGETARYSIRFNLSALLRGDDKARGEYYHLGITDGWLNRNEVRSLEDLNPADGLDEFLVPLNMGDADDPSRGERAQAIVRAEVRALKVEYLKRDAAAFSDWASDYYARLRDRIWSELDATTEQAGRYTGQRLAVIATAETLPPFFDHWSAHGAAELLQCLRS